MEGHFGSILGRTKTWIKRWGVSFWDHFGPNQKMDKTVWGSFWGGGPDRLGGVSSDPKMDKWTFSSNRVTGRDPQNNPGERLQTKNTVEISKILIIL